MNKIVYKYSILIILCLFLACRNKSEVKQVVETWNGKQFILPDDSLVVNSNKITINPLSKKIKIVTAINASCGACISELRDWMVFMKDFDTSQVGFIFLLYSNDHLMAFEKINPVSIHFTYPYFHDKGKKVFLKNNIPEHKLYQTFLLDSTNHVVLVGNPINNKELSALYKSEIQKAKTITDQFIESQGVKMDYKNNRAYLYFGNEVIWQDESGKRLSKKEAKELCSKNDCWLDQSSPNLVIIRKRSESN
jgi:hypothetical protein